MQASLNFNDQVVIVTGAGNGLGRSHAQLFASLGAHVIVNDLGSEKDGRGVSTQAADAVVAEITAMGGSAIANYDSVVNGEGIVQQALEHFGRVDVLVNNAGILRDKSFHKMSLEEWQAIQEVHCQGAFSLTSAAWPLMRENNYGRLIFTASASGMYGNFGQANYGAAKLGLVGLMRTLAVEGRSKNIHANAIAPMVDSRMLTGLLPDEWIKKLKPELVSPLVAYLCHNTCTETGGLYEAGAGRFCKVRWQRAEGLDLSQQSQVSVDELAAGFASVQNFTEAHYPDEVMQAGMHLLNISD